MPTALASQLASQASLNAQLLSDRSKTRGKHASVESYLFANSREAAEHDLDSIFALGRSGFDALSIIIPQLHEYEESLFSYHAKNIDRTLLPIDAGRDLDTVLDGCLQEIGAYLLESAASKMLEWLVRRFRVNEFNVRAVVALFLPYHETQHWGKMLTILHLDKEPVFKFLVPHQKQAQKPTSAVDLILPRQALVQAMLRDGDVARLVVGLLSTALKGQTEGSFSRGKYYKTLVAFWAATMHDFVLAHGSNGSKSMSEGTSALVFSAVLQPLSIIPKMKAKASKKGKSIKYESIERDTVFTSYILLAALSSRSSHSLTPAALKIIISSLVGAAASGTGIGAPQLVKTLVAVCASQNELPESHFSEGEEILTKLLAIPDVLPEIVQALGSWDGAEKIFVPFTGVVVDWLSSSDVTKASQSYHVLEIILSSAVPPSVALIHRITSSLLRIATTFPNSSESIRSLLSIVHQRYPSVLKATRGDLEENDDFDEQRIDALLLSLSIPSSTPSSSKSSEKIREALLASSNADSSVRLNGVKSLLTLLRNGTELESMSDALLARTVDSDITVLEALYDHTDQGSGFESVILSTKHNASYYLELLSGVLFPAPSVDTSEVIKPPKRAVVKAHLAFVVKYLTTAQPTWNSDWNNDVFHRIVFPYLIYSKPRGKTTDAVWEILKETGNIHPWIVGCVEHTGAVSEVDDEVERMQALNTTLGERIAANILAQKSSQDADSDYIELISKLVDANSYVRISGLLIIRAMIASADPATAVNFASKVLDAISQEKRSQQLQIQVNETNLDETLSKKLAVQIVTKPNNKAIEGLLYLALLSDIAMLQPSGTKDTVNWVYPASKPDVYAFLMQRLYLCTNTMMLSSAPQARMHVISALFTSLGAEAGVFLVGVWLNSGLKSNKDEDTPLSSAVLSHLSAFLQAHLKLVSGEGRAVDFQTLLPTIIIALSNPSQDVRKAAVECLSILKELSVSDDGKGRKFEEVYAFDRVYGDNQNGSELQYLFPDDLAVYIASLVEMREHCVSDREYIGAWHAEQFASSDKNQEKSSIKYRTHVLCYLLSHVNTLSVLPEAQAAMLRMISPCFSLTQQQSSRKVSNDKRKASPEFTAALSLLPFLRTFAAGVSGSTSRNQNEKNVEGTISSAKLALKVVFGDPGIFQLEDAEYKGGKLWDVLCALLKKVFSGDDAFAPLRSVLSDCATRMWSFAALRKEKRVELIDVVVGAAVVSDTQAQTINEASPVKSLLSNFFGRFVDDQAQIIIAVLNKHGKALAEIIEGDVSVSRPKAKKPRVDSSQGDAATDSSPEEQTNTFQSLSVITEVLASLSITSTASSTTKTELSSLPPSFDLITHLLETLSQVLRFQASGAFIDGSVPVDFVCQNIMSTIDGVAVGVRDPPNLTPTPIRLDVLVEIIRVSANPQTLHQSLLLIAELARLAPESVLRNVMPVFTFMGVGAASTAGGGKSGAEGGGGTSAMLSRDDGYGWRIVQKTVDSIVPVMVSSLKKSHPSSGLDLYIGARDFLRVFTDAANHIPRHRRTNFFSHLITVLGPKDFLAPVCLLLIEKSANKIVRSHQHLLGTGKTKEKDSGDAQSVLALPTSLVHHFEPWLQIWVLAEMLRESERLLQRAISPDNNGKTLLDDSSFEEHSVSPSILYRRRAQAIVIFVGYAAKTFPISPSTSILNPDAMDVVPENTNLSDVVSILIALSTNSTLGGSTEVKIEDVSKSARLSMARVLNVMSATDFIETVLLMLSNENQLIQEGALSLLSTRLPRVAASVRQSAVTSVTKICDLLHNILSKQPGASLTTSAFNAIRAIGSTLCSGEESCITALVPLLVKALNNKTALEIVSAAIGALVPLPAKLGPRLIPHFREIVSQSVSLLREGPAGITADTVQLLHHLLASIPTFWSATEVTHITKLYLELCVSSGKPPVEISNLMRSISKKAPSKILLPTLCDLWRSLEIVPNIHALAGYFDLLKRSIRNAGRPAVQDNLRALFSVFISAFEVVSVLEVSEVNNLGICRLVVKLNESSFRPLFRRLYDWAFAGESDPKIQIMFCHIFCGLLDYFKGLMNPYMSMLLPPLTDILKNCISADSAEIKDLLSPVLETLSKSLACDDGSFWRDDKIRQLSSTLIALIPGCAKLSQNDTARTLLQDCLVAGAESVTDDNVLKAMNLDILMHTRSEDLLGFVSETTTFIAECCEDENDLVTRESFKLKDAVESVAGSISGL
ncbi:armadillo-type protein [Rhodocollybia butyracea]|uniref:U3 small nucleolar RNA-associated protein 10 n=1 Tax=Rhodocollybia butyracea TaxID=206335 RepID=A0A9P5UFH2_9AGAR|nr:armadillo-type protein [Rhodocollybia butyracea]